MNTHRDIHDEEVRFEVPTPDQEISEDNEGDELELEEDEDNGDDDEDEDNDE